MIRCFVDDWPDSAELCGWQAVARTARERTTVLNPNSAYAWMASGYVIAFSNIADKSIEAFHRTIRLSPLDPLSYRFTSGLATGLLIAGAETKRQ